MADRYLMDIYRPRNFGTDQGNALNELDKSFESLCAALEEAGVSKPKELTVYEFRSRVEFFQNRKKRET